MRSADKRRRLVKPTLRGGSGGPEAEADCCDEAEGAGDGVRDPEDPLGGSGGLLSDGAKNWVVEYWLVGEEV